MRRRLRSHVQYLHSQANTYCSALLIDIKAMTASLSESTALINDNVSRILVRIQSSEMGMCLLFQLSYIY